MITNCKINSKQVVIVTNACMWVCWDSPDCVQSVSPSLALDHKSLVITSPLHVSPRPGKLWSLHWCRPPPASQRAGRSMHHGITPGSKSLQGKFSLLVGCLRHDKSVFLNFSSNDNKPITYVLMVLFHCYDLNFPRVAGGSGSGVQQTFAIPSATTTTQSWAHLLESRP